MLILGHAVHGVGVPHPRQGRVSEVVEVVEAIGSMSLGQHNVTLPRFGGHFPYAKAPCVRIVVAPFRDKQRGLERSPEKPDTLGGH